MKLAAIFCHYRPSMSSRIVAEIEKQFTRLDARRGPQACEANLKRYRAAVLKAACEGRLVPPRPNSPAKKGRDYETGERLLARILKERRAKWEADQLAQDAHPKAKHPRTIRWKGEVPRKPVAPDTTNIPTLPEGWTWASLGQITSLVTSGSRGWAEHYAQRGAQFIRAQDIKRDRLSSRPHRVGRTTAQQ